MVSTSPEEVRFLEHLLGVLGEDVLVDPWLIHSVSYSANRTVREKVIQLRGLLDSKDRTRGMGNRDALSCESLGKKAILVRSLNPTKYTQPLNILKLSQPYAWQETATIQSSGFFDSVVSRTQRGPRFKSYGDRIFDRTRRDEDSIEGLTHEKGTPKQRRHESPIEETCLAHGHIQR